MMISLSIYSLFDGFFVSNFAGKTPFAAVNLVWPIIMTLASLGFMMGAGGSALVAKRFGEGKEEEANRCFSSAVIFSIILGVLTTILVFFFIEPICLALGADEEMIPYCVTYGRILTAGLTFFNLQNLFQNFLITAGKPTLGFIVTLSAGVVNVALDAILIAGFKLGVIGAGIGTIAGQAVGGIIPLVYFCFKNKSSLRFRPNRLQWGSLGKMITNGSSEFVNNISASAVSMVLNYALMQYFGQNGVGAYGIICYVWMIYAAIFIGYNVAVAPRISYALGAGDKEELRNLYRKSVILLFIFGVIQFALAEALAVPLSYLFGGYDQELLELTIRASLIYGLTYLFLGVNMFSSAFFTALNNGFVSLLLSFIRLGVLEIAAVMIVPSFLGGDGIWYSIPIAEFLGLLIATSTMHSFGKRYGYVRSKVKEEKS